MDLSEKWRNTANLNNLIKHEKIRFFNNKNKSQIPIITITDSWRQKFLPNLDHFPQVYELTSYVNWDYLNSFTCLIHLYFGGKNILSGKVFAHKKF